MARAAYVVVEGLIGVGKTTLAERLADALGGRLVRERFADNPFLPRFYADRRAHALSTQLFFLMDRYRQQEALAQPDLFSPVTVADYLFDKDRIFAELTLAPPEWGIYERLFRALAPAAPRPDLVVRLVASVDETLGRIARRGRGFERGFDRAYLAALAEGYDAFFAAYRDAPVVEVDTSGVDLRTDEALFEPICAAARDVPTAGLRLGPTSPGSRPASGRLPGLG